MLLNKLDLGGHKVPKLESNDSAGIRRFCEEVQMLLNTNLKLKDTGKVMNNNYYVFEESKYLPNLQTLHTSSTSYDKNDEDHEDQSNSGSDEENDEDNDDDEEAGYELYEEDEEDEFSD